MSQIPEPKFTSPDTLLGLIRNKPEKLDLIKHIWTLEKQAGDSLLLKANYKLMQAEHASSEAMQKRLDEAKVTLMKHSEYTAWESEQHSIRVAALEDNDRLERKVKSYKESIQALEKRNSELGSLLQTHRAKEAALERENTKLKSSGGDGKAQNGESQKSTGVDKAGGRDTGFEGDNDITATDWVMMAAGFGLVILVMIFAVPAVESRRRALVKAAWRKVNERWTTTWGRCVATRDQGSIK